MKRLFNPAQIFKNLLFTFFFFSSLLCTAQQNEIVAKLVNEGIALHDKGDYEAAIAKFDRALILDPYDYEANFEKSSSLLYAGKYDESIAISKLLIEKFKDQPSIKSAYVALGSAWDDKGNADSALLAYNDGIKRFPDFYLLHFNKGLTYARQKKWGEAEVSFYETMKLKPNHAGSLYYTSLMHEKSNKVAAIISGLTFLAVEPEGKRAKGMYEYMFELFGSFAQKTDKGANITLSMDDFDKKDKENNFSMVNMMMGLTVASSITDSVKAKTDVAKLSLYMQMMTSSLSTGQKEGKGIYWKTYAPFLIAMKEKDQMDVFAHIASITSGNEENIKWINDNQDKLKAFYEWMDKYKWTK
jgi:hypothetical protein